MNRDWEERIGRAKMKAGSYAKVIWVKKVYRVSKAVIVLVRAGS